MKENVERAGLGLQVGRKVCIRTLVVIRTLTQESKRFMCRAVFTKLKR